MFETERHSKNLVKYKVDDMASHLIIIQPESFKTSLSRDKIYNHLRLLHLFFYLKHFFEPLYIGRKVEVD